MLLSHVMVMWSVEYHVTTPSCIAMATSAASSAAASSSVTSRRQCVGRAPGMLLEDIFELCRKSKDIFRWLRRELINGDFTDQDCPGVLKDGQKCQLLKE